jgi:hypothetical protein
MPELLGKIQSLKAYNTLREQRSKEYILEPTHRQVAVDGLYGVMLRLNSRKTIGQVGLMLPGLVTGIAPELAEDCIMLRVGGRNMQPTSVRVSMYDGLFSDFNGDILASAGDFGPEVTEGFLVEHPAISSREASLRRILNTTVGEA